MRIRRHKYGAKRTVCNLGHRHPSKKEAGYCNQLNMLVKSKKIYAFEYERRFELVVNRILIGHHKPDFCIYPTKEDYDEDYFEVHEVKGAMTRDWNWRRKLFEAINPHIKYVLIR